MPRYNNVHKQQLFHWIGAHIDFPDAAHPGRRIPVLEDRHREAYLESLTGALRDGLWVKRPRVPDHLGDGSVVKVTRPITCFTEWSLDESLPHTTRYGRLGLGFSKRFVSGRGGQPVTYVRDMRRGDPYTGALVGLLRAFRTGAVRGRNVAALTAQLEYLSHFAKRNRVAAKKREPRPERPVRKTAAGMKAPDGPAAAVKRFARRYGSTLQYLEEREWRIVHDASLGAHFISGPASGVPDFFLPFVSGEELFTVVLPDNRTVNMALHSAPLRRRIFPRDTPHVTILSLEDIGTF
jgi:hypothetical protein